MLALLSKVVHHPVHHRISVVSRVNGLEAKAKVNRVGRPDSRTLGDTSRCGAKPVIIGGAARGRRADSLLAHADLKVLQRVAGELDVIHKNA
jgi:hypothetical protein